MVKFIPAQELKHKFGVFGHFYSVEIAPKKIVECRSVLEIVEAAHAPEKTVVLSNRKPDAVFIMMNPVNRLGVDAVVYVSKWSR